MSSLPWTIQHFARTSSCLFVWNALVWSLLFLLPTAYRSSSSTTTQRAIALILISLGNVSYWSLARFVTIATKSISNTLSVASTPAQPPAFTIVVVHRVQPSEVQSVAPAPTVVPAVSGLNSAQVKSRNRARDRCSMASAAIRNMMLIHLGASVAFFVLCIVLSSSHLQSYWIYATLWYWALVCLLRLQVLPLPLPKT